MFNNKVFNKLENQLSPYLLLHKDNPINWFPWGKEAFEFARTEDKPIFLSIGYSTCHWCHVMNRESFSDKDIAELLNKNFISIKVDREQHPDVDTVYMDACVKFTGAGGWPLNLFLTPNLKPFYAGTYFPKRDGLRSIGFETILKRIDWLWKNDRETLLRVSEEAFEVPLLIDSKNDDFNQELVIDQLESLKDRYDSLYGGFLPAPKFPQLHNLLFMLSIGRYEKDVEALDAAEDTLKSVIGKGCYDHVGGGLYRYSTDRYYKIPHFEKMLYDNAFLIYVLAEFYLATKNNFYKERCLDVLTYLNDSLKSSSGGYYTAEDADSKAGEGAFYLYSVRELDSIFSPEEMSLFKEYFEFSDGGNFQGKIHLYPKGEKEFTALVENAWLRQRLKELLTKLGNYRQTTRELPFIDKKILVYANGLLLAAFSKALIFSKEAKDSANDLYNFIKSLILKDTLPGALMNDGEVISNGHLDDYAFICMGLIEYGLSIGGLIGKEAIEEAKTLIQRIDKLFLDHENGGYYFIEEDTVLPKRPKSYFEGAFPEGNSIMGFNLYRLFQLTGTLSFRDSLERLLKDASTSLKKYKGSAPFLTMIGSWYLGSSYEIVLSGETTDQEEMKEFEERIKMNFLGGSIFWVLDNTGKKLGIEEGKEKPGLNLYLCKDGSCDQIVSGNEAINKKLKDMLNIIA